MNVVSDFARRPSRRAAFRLVPAVLLAAAAGAAAADQPDAVQVTAQPAVAPAAVPPTDALPADTTSTSSQTGVQNLDTVVVTAQKRKERLQDVPLAVTVVSETQMKAQNITQVDQLARAVPSIETNG